MDKRLEQLRIWLKNSLGLKNFELAPASADASFRRYFRVTYANGESMIVMDALPEKEDSRPFVAVTGILRKQGIHVPEIVSQDLAQGFLLLSDLGRRNYLDALNDHTVDELYEDALAALINMQSIAPAPELPPYDAALLYREMQLFSDWFLQMHLRLTLSNQEQRILSDAQDLLVHSALEQPQVFVHRDYHSRNLMVCPKTNPGILDFQDAVMGPVTYDLVSLLKDCYVAWPKEKVEQWAMAYLRRLKSVQIVREISSEEFLGWFHLMGAQRHLKAIGIFCRLLHRDGKPQFLGDVPRTMSYLRAVWPTHPELKAFGKFLEGRVVPALESL